MRSNRYIPVNLVVVWGLSALVFLIGVGLIFGFLVAFIRAPKVTSVEQLEEDVVIGDMRGGRIVQFYTPHNRSPRESLVVTDDGMASRGIPYTYHRETRLPPEDWEAVNALREAWCQSPPQFRDLQLSTPRYSVNLRCSWASIDTQFVRVPVDQLPPALDRLLATVPPPEYR
jgi:hypothetical protein